MTPLTAIGPVYVYLPAVWPVPHPADKEQMVNYEDSCTLVRRRRPRPRRRCHPPRTREEPCAANVSWRRQEFGLHDTLQKHITIIVSVSQICSSVTWGNAENLKAEITDFHVMLGRPGSNSHLDGSSSIIS
jgi:hypothetical protein